MEQQIRHAAAQVAEARLAALDPSNDYWQALENLHRAEQSLFALANAIGRPLGPVSAL